MAAEDVFTFSQNEFLRASFAAFEDMRKKGHLCDLTIKVQNRSFSVHRVILTAGIPGFDSMFCGLEKEDKEFAIGENLDAETLELLIHFAYTGTVDISSENALSLLQAAMSLELTQVQNACLTFLSKKLNCDSVAKVNTLAYSLNNSEVIQMSTAYIQENFEEFAKHEEFLSLPFVRFKEIISGDDLNVSSEEIVFEALIRWVKASPSERQETLPELLSETRLTYLTVQYLMERVESEDLVMSSKGCRELLREARYYHMMPEMESAVSNLKTKPRNCSKKDLYAFCVCLTCGCSVHWYDSNKAKWSILSSIPTSYDNSSSHRIHISAVNGRLFIVLNQTMIIFNIKTREWELLEINYFGLEGAACIPYENMIYYFGSNSTDQKRMLCFDTQNNSMKEMENMKNALEYAAGTVLANSVYITGGGSNHVAKYTPSTDLWSEVSPMLIRRIGHHCSSMNEKIYVCGGAVIVERNARGIEILAEVYDPLTDQWSFFSFLQPPSTFISLLSDHDKIYAFRTTDGEMYDTRTWRRRMSFNVPIGFMKVVLAPTHNYNQKAIDAGEGTV